MQTSNYVPKEPLTNVRFQVVATTLLINILSLALPLTLLQIYDRIIPNQSYSTATLVFGGVAIAIMIESFLRFARTYMIGRVGASYEHVAGKDAFNRFLHAELEEFEKIGTGKHLERFNALGTARDYYSGQTAQALYDFPFSIVFFIIIFYLGGALVLVPILGMTLFILFTYHTKEKLQELQSKHIEANDDRYNFLLSVLSGLHSIKAMAMEKLLYRRYQKLQEKRNERLNTLESNNSQVSGLSHSLSQLCTVGIVAFGCLYVMTGNMTVGALAACTILTGRSLQLFQNAVSYWMRLQTTQVDRDRFNEIFTLPQEEALLDEAAFIKENLKGKITFKKVSFKHKNCAENLFENISLDIESHEMIGITGNNGCGKTTLLTLMKGMWTPTSGEIQLDGYPLSKYHPSILKTQIAFVSEGEEIFKGSILENITLFRSEMADLAYAACVLIGVDETIKNLPQGYQTLIGVVSDETLPRGLQQRIAIARALVDKPRIVLFDEANITDDHHADEALKTLIDCLKKTLTLIVVSRRPSILAKADRVFEITQKTFLQK